MADDAPLQWPGAEAYKKSSEPKPWPGAAAFKQQATPSGDQPKIKMKLGWEEQAKKIPTLKQTSPEQPSIAQQIGKLSPDLLSNAIGGVMDKAAGAVQGGISQVLQHPLPGLAPNVGMSETGANQLGRDAIMELMRRGGEVAPEAAIKSPALKTAEGVKEGPNHPAIRAQGGEGQPGFTTTAGQFVDRGQGAEIAKETGQAKPETGASLHSEDMKPGASEAVAPPKPVGAASTPLHEIVSHNIRTFEEANKGPGFKQSLKDAVSEMRSFYETKQTGKQIIRKAAGGEARTAAQAKAAMAPFRDWANSLGMEEQLSLLEWIETPESKLKQGLQASPEANGFMNTFRGWMQTYQKKLESISQTEKMDFVKNFVTHLWRNPKSAMTAISEYGAKQGSAYFTKARVFNTYADGIRAGLAPLTTDPMELFARYIENASKKIASWETINDAKDRGLVVYRTPMEAPQGWVKLNAHAPPGQEAYAPAGFATVYNNFVSQAAQWKPGGVPIDLFDAASRAANATTTFKLMLPGFHTTLETIESVISATANGIDKIAGGDVLGGVVKIVGSPLKPFTSYATSKMLQKGYLDGEWGSPELQRIIQAGVDANYQFQRGGLADEYRISKTPGFIKSWERGRLKQEAREAIKDIKQAPLTGGARQIYNNGIRAFQTVAEPTFEYYIPWLKNANFYDMMKTYLDKNPNISREGFAKFASFASDTIDGRLGEMNKSNIFWNATAKKMAQTATISYSYTLGTARQILGPAWDAARLPDRAMRAVKGTLPEGEQVWTPRLSFAIATGLWVGLVNSIYQYLHTGKMPEETMDLMHGQTGGTDPSTKKPERGTIPMFFNSFRNFWLNPEQEAWNKTNPMWQAIIDTIENKDWKNQPISNANDSVTKRLEQIGAFVADEVGKPVVFGNVEDKKAGSHITTPETIMGVRTAGMKDTDPEKLGKIMDFKNADAWLDKLKSDANKKRAQQGLPPISIPHRARTQMIQRLMKDPEYNPFPSYGGTGG